MTPRRQEKRSFCVALVAETPLRDRPTRFAESPIAWVIAAIVLALILLAASSAWAADSTSATAPVIATSDSSATSASSSSSVTTSASNVTSGEAAPSAWPPGLLMDGLGAVGLRKPLDDLGIRTYGFFETGITSNLANEKSGFGRVYDSRRMDQWRFNQLDLTVDRPYDSSKSFDWGFRIDGLSGGDAMFTHAQGLFDHAGVSHTDAWADLLQFYGQAWFKTGAESGLEVTFGKFLELAGSESALAVNNQLYSHSFIYNYAEPTTNTGVVAKYIFDSQWFAYAGAIEGWDVFRDNNDSASFVSGGGWSTKEQVGGHARAQILLNLITGPEQTNNSRDYRNLTDLVATYSWTDKLTESLNFDWVEEQSVPGVGRENAFGPAHYLTYAFNDYVSATWRTEWFRDEGGSRIGVAGNFAENTLGLTVTPCPADKVWKNLSVRPELRWDNSDQRVFDHGTRENGATAAVDIIFKF